MFDKNIHYSQDLEQAVLGACILEKSAFSRIFGVLKHDMFYNEGHKKVFEVLGEMFDKNVPIDMITLWDYLVREKGVKEFVDNNTAYYVSTLTNAVVSTAHLEYHSLVLQEMWVQRELLKISLIGRESSQDKISAVNKKLNELQSSSSSGEWKPLDHLLVDLYKHQDKMTETQGMGIPTGFKTIDRLYGGFHKGQMIVIGARPSMGKSALIGRIAMNIAEQKFTVGIVSLEMSNNEITARLASLDTGIDYSTIFRALWKDESQRDKFYHHVNNSTAALPIYISDKTDVNMSAIKAQALKLKYKQGLDILIIDYLQLVGDNGSPNRNRENAVAEISRGFKILCKELDIPGIILCQLNREVVKRKGVERFPQLSDLRESGSIEQDADAVIFLHRDFLSGILEDENGQSTEHSAHMVIRKWRNGIPNVIVDMDFEGKIMSFKEKETFQHTPAYEVRTPYADNEPPF